VGDWAPTPILPSGIPLIVVAPESLPWATALSWSALMYREQPPHQLSRDAALQSNRLHCSCDPHSARCPTDESSALEGQNITAAEGAATNAPEATGPAGTGG
jgi:hypothetical protein